jgi:hypothetical protein
MAIDPRDRFIYAAGGNLLFVVDIRPGSPDYHKLRTITLAGPVHDLRGLAVSADGRRLYVAAPETTLYGDNGWYRTNFADRKGGRILVVNVDLADRPAAGAPNARKYLEEIKAIDVGYEPYDIVATGDPHKLAFSTFLDADRGFNTLTVTDDGVSSFSATVARSTWS